MATGGAPVTIVGAGTFGAPGGQVVTVQGGGVNGYLSSIGIMFDGVAYRTLSGGVNGLVVQSALPGAMWSYAAASGGIVNTTTAVTLKAAAGAGVRNYLKSLSLSHDALGAATEIAIRDGAAGAVLWRGRLQTTAIEDAVLTFDPPLKGTADTLLEVATLTAVTGGVYVNASGYTGV